MLTLWERRWDWLSGGTSVSVERSMTARAPSRAHDVPYTFLLLLRRRYVLGTRAGQIGVMHRGRRPIGVALLSAGVLRQRWWGS